MLLIIDRGARPAEPCGDGMPPRGLRRRLTAWYRARQDRAARDDETWAADCGYDSWRSPSGWTVRVRDRRFDLRQECIECAGGGRHPITGAECEACGGTGVITLDPDEGGELPQ